MPGQAGHDGSGVVFLVDGVGALVFGDGFLQEFERVGDPDLAGQDGQIVRHFPGDGVFVVADLGDADAVVEGRERVLRIVEDFFVELLAGPQAGVFDLDVLVGREAGEGDHPARELVDLDGLAHVEHDDLGAGGQGGRFEHEAAGLRDGHEEAVDVGVRDRDGAARGDLFLETGNHAAVGAQDIAEAGGHEPGAPLDLAFLDGEAQRLDVDLGHALGAPHHAGGVDGFVGGDHHHLLDVVFQAFVGDVAGAQDVDEDRFAGVFLHQGDVFVGRGVEDDLGVPGAEREVEPVRVADIADDGHEVQALETVFELEPEIVHRGLGVVEEDQFPDAQGGELQGQLRTDGSGGPRDHHGLADEARPNLVHRHGDLLAAQEVLHLHVAGVEEGLAVHHFVDGGDDQGLDAVLRAEADQPVRFCLGVGVAGEENGVHPFFEHDPVQFLVVPETVDGQLVEGVFALVFAPLEETLHGEALGVLQALEGRDALVGGAVEEDLLLVGLLPGLAVEEELVGQDHRDPGAEEHGFGDEEVQDEDQQELLGVEPRDGQDRQDEQHLPDAGLHERDGVPDREVADDDTERAGHEEERDRGGNGRSQIQDQEARRVERVIREPSDNLDGSQRGCEGQQGVRRKDDFAPYVGILKVGDQLHDLGGVV